LPGDYNLDRAIDAADYAVWRASRGNTTSRFSGADGNGNGVIDQPDYQVWRSNFGATLPASAPPLAAASQPVADPIGTPDGPASDAPALVSEPAPTTQHGAVASALASDDVFASAALQQRSRDAATATHSRFAAMPTRIVGNRELLLVLDRAFSDQDRPPLDADALDAAFSYEVDEIDLASALAVTLASL
jgi:hypothetical protein